MHDLEYIQVIVMSGGRQRARAALIGEPKKLNTYLYLYDIQVSCSIA